MKLSARSALRATHDAVRTQLWPLPVLGIVLAIALGILLPLLDARMDQALPDWLDALVFSGDAGAARTVLNAVASSLITVTSLTFSLTVVTLQLASSQFSPRLLRTFTQDSFVQVTLAIFLATFTFSLTVLRSVRSAAESASPFVPRLAVTTSFLLAIASVTGLVLFLAHLTRQIRVETMLRHVHDDATDTLLSNLEPRTGEALDQVTADPPAGAQVLWAQQSGFFLRIDRNEILRAAETADAVVLITRHPGSFVADGTPLGFLWDRKEGELGQERLDAFLSDFRQAVHLGPERTAAQDIGYGLRQLTDVTNKALSPGINDPTTAIHALGHTSALLTELTGYQLGVLVLRGEDDEPRVLVDRPGFDHFLDLALTQPRSYGQADTEVLARLYLLLTDLAWHARKDHLGALLQQLRRLEHTVAKQEFDETEMAKLDRLRKAVYTVLAHPAAAANRP